MRIPLLLFVIGLAAIASGCTREPDANPGAAASCAAESCYRADEGVCADLGLVGEAPPGFPVQWCDGEWLRNACPRNESVIGCCIPKKPKDGVLCTETYYAPGADQTSAQIACEDEGAGRFVRECPTFVRCETEQSADPCGGAGSCGGMGTGAGGNAGSPSFDCDTACARIDVCDEADPVCVDTCEAVAALLAPEHARALQSCMDDTACDVTLEEGDDLKDHCVREVVRNADSRLQLAWAAYVDRCRGMDGSVGFPGDLRLPALFTDDATAGVRGCLEAIACNDTSACYEGRFPRWHATFHAPPD